MDGNYEFVSPEWDDISEQAKDLVSTVKEASWKPENSSSLQLHMYIAYLSRWM